MGCRHGKAGNTYTGAASASPRLSPDEYSSSSDDMMADGGAGVLFCLWLARDTVCFVSSIDWVFVPSRPSTKGYGSSCLLVVQFAVVGCFAGVPGNCWVEADCVKLQGNRPPNL